jgi:hypothetical protein
MPLCTKKHRLLAFPNTAWLSPGGFSPASREMMQNVERETGLEPATACLEGRVSQDRRSLGIDRPWEPIEQVFLKLTLR